MRSVIVPKGHNLSVYYLLPLLCINKDTFQGFINSYISYNGKIIVKVHSTPAVEYWKHPQYVTDFTEGTYTYIVYELPKDYVYEFGKFLEGKYSEYRNEAKMEIYRHSGLKCNFKNPDGTVVTHNMLLVLDKHPVLRQLLEDELGSNIEEESELLEKPDIDQEVMDIDTDVHY